MSTVKLWQNYGLPCPILFFFVYLLFGDFATRPGRLRLFFFTKLLTPKSALRFAIIPLLKNLCLLYLQEDKKYFR